MNKKFSKTATKDNNYRTNNKTDHLINFLHKSFKINVRSWRLRPRSAFIYHFTFNVIISLTQQSLFVAEAHIGMFVLCQHNYHIIENALKQFSYRICRYDDKSQCQVVILYFALIDIKFSLLTDNKFISRMFLRREQSEILEID